MDFIAFATSTKAQVAIALEYNYGPVVTQAWKEVPADRAQIVWVNRRHGNAQRGGLSREYRRVRARRQPPDEMEAGPVATAFWRALAWKPLERLGVVSYSTYLAHWPVLVVCQALYRALLGDPTPAQLFALHVAISFPLVALASFALYRFVEAPGIALGRRLTRGKRT